MSANTTQTVMGRFGALASYSEGAVLSPSADSDEAGHQFRFEAGRDSDLMPATQRSLPRIGR